MTEEKKPNSIAKLLAEKKAKKNLNNTFNPKGGIAPKPSKGFGGPSLVRRTGRGK